MSASYLLLPSVSTWKVQQIFGLLARHSLLVRLKLGTFWDLHLTQRRVLQLKIFECNSHVELLVYRLRLEMECGSQSWSMDLWMRMYIFLPE